MANVPIPAEWLDYLLRQPESGMGYQIVSVRLKDGRHFKQVIAQNGYFTQVRGYDELPFTQLDEIASVFVNHKRWNFRSGR